MLVGGDAGIDLLILSFEVFNSGKKPLRFGAKLSGARTFEVYLWTGRTLLGESELSGGEEGLVCGAEPEVDLTWNGLMTGNEVVRGPKPS